jgi:tRNA (cytidine/uridine-2'-O-)-methyltransferase
MLNIVLFEPEIPNNTGSIMRLCANMGANLHLIKPYGFEMDDKKLRRAGLDYRDLACVNEYENFEDYLQQTKPNRIFCLTTKTDKPYTSIKYQSGDSLMFGPETRGLPPEIMNRFEKVTIPMRENSRSINLSNSVSIASYEAWRQLDFK